MVVTGSPGLDEVSVSGATQILQITADEVSHSELTPSDFGASQHDYETIPGGDAEENAGIFLRLIEGKGEDSITDMVCASGAVAMHCQGTVGSIQDGFLRCKDLLADGTVAAKFHEFRSISESLQN